MPFLLARRREGEVRRHGEVGKERDGVGRSRGKAVPQAEESDCLQARGCRRDARRVARLLCPSGAQLGAWPGALQILVSLHTGAVAAAMSAVCIPPWVSGRGRMARGSCQRRLLERRL